jgi:ubiquitin C-terminal hydrolase
VVTVQDCLKAFVEEERLEGSEAVRCEGCKKSCAHTKRLQIWKPPMVLVLTLKRFAQRSTGSSLFSRFRYGTCDELLRSHKAKLLG